MQPKYLKKLALLLLTAALLISACGPNETTATPTQLSLDAVYTQAAATVFAAQTGTQGAQPTKTTTPTLTITPTLALTSTPSPTVKAAVFVPAQPVVATIAITTTGTPGTPVPSITPPIGGAVGGKNSSLVSESSTAGLKAGEKFTKTWVIKNNGTGTWNGNFKIVYVSGDLMGRDYSTKIRATVGPGGTYTQNLDFTAPTKPGTTTSSWRLMDEAGTAFGTVFTVSVTIAGATYTPTSAAANSTATAAANATATAAALAGANAANQTATAAAAGTAAANANLTAIANGVAGTATANAIATSVAATSAANAAATQTQAAIDAANATATQAAIDAKATADSAALTAAAPPPSGP